MKVRGVGPGGVLLALTLAGSACVDRAPATAGKAPFTYVAVGASDTVGTGGARPRRDGWPSVFHRTALPPGVRYVNLGVGGITVAEVLATQVRRAEAADAALATVWLAVNDLFRLVPAARYERDLATLVRRLRATGAEVLLGNTPPLDHLPIVRACLVGAPADSGCQLNVRVPVELVLEAVHHYNRAIERVAEREGAVLVDLHAAGVAARDDGSELWLVSRDGLHPSTAGHRRIAEVFAEALRASPRTRSLARR